MASTLSRPPSVSSTQHVVRYFDTNSSFVLLITNIMINHRHLRLLEESDHIARVFGFTPTCHKTLSSDRRIILRQTHRLNIFIKLYWFLQFQHSDVVVDITGYIVVWMTVNCRHSMFYFMTTRLP